jgi:hypothetical protein
LRIAGDHDDVVPHVVAHLLHLPPKRLSVEVRSPLAIGRFYLEVDNTIWHGLRVRRALPCGAEH